MAIRSNPLQLFDRLGEALNIGEGKKIIDRLGQPFNDGLELAEELKNKPFNENLIEIANIKPKEIYQAIEAGGRGANTGGLLEKRNSGTYFRDPNDFLDKTGIRLSNTPKTVLISSPSMVGIRGNSVANFVTPQNEQLGRYIKGFDPAQLVDPLILVGKNNDSHSFFGIDKVKINDVRPNTRLTDPERIGATLSTIEQILKHPDIPDEAKQVLVKNIGSRIFGGFKNNTDSLDIDYGALSDFTQKLTGNKGFKEVVGDDAVKALYETQRQYSTLNKLNAALSSPYARTRQGFGDDMVLGVTLKNTNGVPHTPYPVQTQQYIPNQPQPPKEIVYFNGLNATPNPEELKKQRLLKEASNARYEQVALDPTTTIYPVTWEDVHTEGKFFDRPEDVSNYGKQNQNIKSIIGGGNVIFGNKEMSVGAAKLLQEQYARGFGRVIQNDLHNSIGKTIETLDDNGRRVIREAIPQLTDASPDRTIGYVTRTVPNLDGTVRNTKSLAIKTNGGIKQGSIKLDGNQVKFNVWGGTSGNALSIPIGEISREVNALGEEVIKLPPALSQAVTGRINYKPEDLLALDYAPAFKEGQDKLQALADVATRQLPDSGTVQFPIGLKRYSLDTDNFLASSLPDDPQSQLLARAMNYADPNLPAIKRLGIATTPDSRWGKAIQVKPVEGINSVAILPVSNDIQQASGKTFDELYEQQLIGGDGKPVTSAVLPYNDIDGNPLLLQSVENAWKKITGTDAKIQYTTDSDGVPLAYLGHVPSQARSFPTAKTWAERGRGELLDPKSISKAISSWTGSNDKFIPRGEQVTTARNNTQTAEGLMAEITGWNPDAELSGYARTDNTRTFRKEPEEHYGTGIAAHSARSGDLYNVGEPVSSADARYSVALKTLTDPRFSNYIQDKPSFINDPNFRAMYANESDVSLNTDQIDELERWLDSNNLGFSAGQGSSIAPLSIVEQEARDFTPAFSVSPSYGTPADDYHGTIVDSSGVTSIVPMGRNQIQYGLDPEDIVSVRTYGRGKDAVANAAMDAIENRSVRNRIPYPVSRDADGNIVRIAAPFNRPTQGTSAVRKSSGLEDTRNVIIQQPLTEQQLNNEMMFNANTQLPAIELYQQLAENYQLPVMNAPAASVRNSNTLARQVNFTTNQAPLTISQSDAFRDIDYNIPSPSRAYRTVGVDEQKELAPIQLSPNATPEEKAIALQWAKRNLNNQQARQSIAQARASDEELRAVIQSNWQDYGIPPEQTIKQLQTAGFYQDQADMLARHNQIRAEIEAGVRLNPNNPLEGLHLGEANQGYVESFMNPEDVSNWSDNHRYEANTSTWEPSVNPVYDDPIDEPTLLKSVRYAPEVNPQYIVQGDNGTQYIYVPDDVQRKLQDDYDREAIRQRQAYENNPLRFINDEKFSAIQPNILNDAGQNWGRTDEILMPTPTPVWNQQLQAVINATPANQKAAFDAQVQANIAANKARANQPSQPVVVINNGQPTAAVRTSTNPEPSNLGGISQGNTQSVTQSSNPSTPAAVRYLTPEQQQYMMLGLGGAGAYGLYSSMNQQDNRRVA